MLIENLGVLTHIADGIFPLHCFTYAKEVVLESHPFCIWSVNNAMIITLNEQWHDCS